MRSAEEVTNGTLVVFGATGTTGSHVMRQALAQGMSVRAAVRSPDKLPADLVNEARLEVV
ncbi:MAG: NAD(P)H-binding protein, partial [Myxococcota bacterium]